jgi:hypothetical protein
MALLVAVPLLSLILIRMIWSGSSLWFLLAGLLLLAGAAVTFLARRPQGLDFDRQALEMEPNRWPLVLGGLGVLFLALLLVPNFAGGGSGGATISQQPNTPVGDVLDNTQQPAAQPTAQAQQPSGEQPAGEEPADAPAAGDGEVYVVKSGDSLWGIAQQYSTTVDAIVAANGIANPADLQVGQELVIPAAEEASASSP